MSKLADAIRRSQRIEAAPMGFGAARPAPKATMLVGVIATDEAAVRAAQEAGADIVMLDARSREVSPADAEKLHAAAGDKPVGTWANVGGASTQELREKGLDFIAFDPETTPAAALLDEDMGYVLVLPKDPEEIFLRSLEPVQLDALYLSEVPSTLTVSRQIELGRISMFARKPLLCQVKADATKEELQCLRAVGASVLLVDSASGVAKLKETVLSLPQKRQKRDERTVVSLPRAAAPVAGHEDDDDDE